MPGGDGTGPLGRGPMTGWGRGFCRGFGRGFGRGAWTWPAPVWGAPAQPTKEQTLSFLEGQQKALESELDALKRQIEELKKQ